jgi:hypothetical protein
VRLHRVGRKRDCRDLCQRVGVEHRDQFGLAADDLVAVRDGDRPDFVVSFDDFPAEVVEVDPPEDVQASEDDPVGVVTARLIITRHQCIFIFIVVINFKAVVVFIVRVFVFIISFSFRDFKNKNKNNRFI